MKHLTEQQLNLIEKLSIDTAELSMLCIAACSELPQSDETGREENETEAEAEPAETVSEGEETGPEGSGSERDESVTPTSPVNDMNKTTRISHLRTIMIMAGAALLILILSLLSKRKK